jgi:Tol biopolymer transport system component
MKLKFYGIIIATLLLLFHSKFCCATEKILPIQEEFQGPSNWCWVASSLSILHYYGETDLEQCNIADYARMQYCEDSPELYCQQIGSENCCGPANDICCDVAEDFCCTNSYEVECNQPNFTYLDGMLNEENGSFQGILKHWGIDSIVVPDPNAPDTTSPHPLPWDTVVSEIESNRPFVIRWGYSEDDPAGHFAVGMGYDDENNKIYLMDPWLGYSVESYDWVVGGFDDGYDREWTHSLQITTEYVMECEEHSIELISVATDGAQANDDCWLGALSDDGRYVVFNSKANNLDSNRPDTNEHFDVFIRDRVQNTTKRISLAADGTEANGDSYSTSMSSNGHYVVFRSKADNLVENDTNNMSDVFVYDREADSIKRVSVTSDGTEVMRSSNGGKISGDGRYILFYSSSSELALPEEEPHMSFNLIIHDQTTGETTALFTPGTYTFTSSPLPATSLSVSRNGRFVTFSAVKKNSETGFLEWDLYLHDRHEQTTEQSTKQVSVDEYGLRGDCTSTSWADRAISDDGRYVVFCSCATNLDTTVDLSSRDFRIFVRDMALNETRCVDVDNNGMVADGFSYLGSISGNGRYVAFSSFATNLDPEETEGIRSLYPWEDIFLYDRTTGITKRVTKAYDGTDANGWSDRARLNRDGRYMLFQSDARNLLPENGDNNNFQDIFLIDRCPDIP